jgi:hypothetical protein
MIPRALILAVLIGSAALPQANQLKGTWSAASGAETMFGSWTARLDAQADVAWGEWRLMDATGKPAAGGAWSARKVSSEWRGSWRAQTQANEAATGTWTAKSTLAGTAALNELIQSAMAQIVGGTWKHGDKKGTWSIRTAQK